MHVNDEGIHFQPRAIRINMVDPYGSNYININMMT